MIIAPSILNVDKSSLNDYLVELDKSGIYFLHLDIMDGHFVKNQTPKAEILKSINHFNFVFDVHLMTIDPIQYVESFANAGADIITFHLEAVDSPFKVIKKIKELGLRVGLSIKPNTPVEDLYPYLKEIDQVLIMSVEPGKGGQAFLDSAYEKVRILSDKRAYDKKLDYIIEVDGGINKEIAKKLNALGANIVVMGTSLIKCENKKALVEELDNL